MVSGLDEKGKKTKEPFKAMNYIGYTATPYANIFIPIDLECAGADLGNDLFPSDCIISLPKPYRYIGANEYLFAAFINVCP